MVTAGRETYGFPYDPFPYVSVKKRIAFLSFLFLQLKICRYKIDFFMYLSVNKYIKIK